jgi:hypothetical protein
MRIWVSVFSIKQSIYIALDPLRTILRHKWTRLQEEAVRALLVAYAS